MFEFFKVKQFLHHHAFVSLHCSGVFFAVLPCLQSQPSLGNMQHSSMLRKVTLSF